MNTIPSTHLIRQLPAVGGGQYLANLQGLRHLGLVTSFCLVLAAVTGCGPSKRVELPGDWPATWKGRQLYNTPNAYIYASNLAVAGDIDRLIIHTCRDFKQRTKAKPTKGLVIVTDVGDEPVTGDMETYYRLTKSNIKGPDQATTLSAEQAERQYAKIEEAVADAGGDINKDLGMLSVTIGDAELVDILGFSTTVAGTVNWAVLMPTRKVIEDNCRDVMQRKLRTRKKLLGELDTVALSPFIVVEESRMVNIAAANRDIALFLQWVWEQSDWNEKQKEGYATKYMNSRVQEAMFPVLSTLRNVLEDLVDTVAEPLAPPRAEDS